MKVITFLWCEKRIYSPDSPGNRIMELDDNSNISGHTVLVRLFLGKVAIEMETTDLRKCADTLLSNSVNN